MSSQDRDLLQPHLRPLRLSLDAAPYYRADDTARLLAIIRFRIRSMSSR